MNHYNRFSKNVIHIAYEVMRIAMIAAMLVVFFERQSHGAYFIHYVIWSGVLFFVGGIACSQWEYAKRVFGKIGGLTAGLIIVILVVFFVFSAHTTFVKMVMLIALSWLWNMGNEFIGSPLYRDKIVMQMILTNVGLFVASLLQLVSKTQTPHLEIVNHYYPFFIILCLLHLYVINLNSVYTSTKVNAINKDRNISRFNGIALCIVLVMFIALQTGFFGMITSMGLRQAISQLIKGIAWVLAALATPVMWVISHFLTWLISLAPEREVASEAVNQSGSAEQFAFYETERLLSVEALNVIQYILWAIVLIGIVYMSYRRLKRKKRQNEEEESDENEEREFIFDLKEWFKGSPSLKKNIDKWLHKNEDSSLHSIRKQYRHFLVTKIEKGHHRQKQMTPNAFKEHLKQVDAISDEEQALTEHYNAVRYGKSD